MHCSPGLSCSALKPHVVKLSVQVTVKLLPRSSIITDDLVPTRDADAQRPGR